MLIRNNDGEIIGEMTTIFAQDGSVIRTNTTHTTGCPIVQNVTVRDNQGNVRTTNVIWGQNSSLIGNRLCGSYAKADTGTDRG